MTIQETKEEFSILSKKIANLIQKTEKKCEGTAISFIHIMRVTNNNRLDKVYVVAELEGSHDVEQETGK